MKLTYEEIAEQLNAGNLNYAFNFDINDSISVEGLYNFAHEDEDFDGEFTESNVEEYVNAMIEMS